MMDGEWSFQVSESVKKKQFHYKSLINSDN